jgi:predicted nucleic acid-binding protein
VKAVVVDTGAWIALLSRDDRHFEAARAHYEALRREGARLLTTNYVVDEAATRFRYGAGLSAALSYRRMLDEAVTRRQLRIAWVDETLEREGWRILEQYADAELSLTDAITGAVARRGRIREVFGFDRDFEALGLLVLPIRRSRCLLPRQADAVTARDAAPERVYRITVGDGRSTEELVEAGRYGYAHSCVSSENFPARPLDPGEVREIVLLEFDREVSAEEAVTAAARLGLEQPVYEDALYFGIEHPEAQRERPIVFLHDPWLGYFGRRDVLCLWTNAGRRELGLEGFDDPFARDYRFAFVRRGAGPG